MITRFLLFTTVIIWGCSFVATKICLHYITPFELLGLRFLIALPLMYLIIFLNKIKFEFGKYKKRLLLGSGLITAHFFIQITGIKYTSATNTGWIIAVTPLVMAVLARSVLKEHLNMRIVAGIVVATAGIILLVSGGRIRDLGWISSYGDWLILASAHTWALYSIATRDLSRSNNPLAVTTALITFPALIVVGIMLFTSDWAEIIRLPGEAIISLLFLGFFAMALAHWFWQIGVARIGAAKAGIFLYLEPLATTALAIPYLGEPFGYAGAVGGILVLIGVWLGQYRRKMRTAKLE